MDKIAGTVSPSAAGLTGSEAAALARFGPNVLKPHRRSIALRFLARFGNPLVIVLLVACAISAATGDATSAAVIAVMAVLLSVVLDFVQEYRAGQAAEQLSQQVALNVSVLRDGARAEIPAEQLVPGDVVLLSAGDLVPADARVLLAQDFFVNQVLLTGEAFPVERHAATAPVDVDRIDTETDGQFWRFPAPAW